MDNDDLRRGKPTNHKVFERQWLFWQAMPFHRGFLDAISTYLLLLFTTRSDLIK
jgi:hypothetical protein